MGMIGDFANSKFGKAVKWTMLGTTLVGAAGVGQQAMIYQESKEPGADVFEMVKTDVDNPTISKTDVLRNFEFDTDVSEAEAQNSATTATQNNGEATHAQGEKNFDLNLNIPGVPQQDNSAATAGNETSQPVIPHAKQDLRGMEDVQVRIPAETFQQVITTLQEIPETQEQMEKTTSNADAQLENQIETPRTLQGSQLAQARVPIPVGEDPIFHMKVPNVFSGDFYSAPLDTNNNWTTINPTGTNLGSVVEQKLPLAISYDMDIGAPDVKVETKIVTPEKMPAPPSTDKAFVYLASADTTVRPMAKEMHVQGKVNVNLDLDGSHTQKKIDQLSQIQKSPNSSPEQVKSATQQILTLQNRLRESKQLNHKLTDAGLKGTAETIMKEQENRLDMQVKFKEGKPLGKAMTHFWLGPDRNNDGKADIYITQELDVSGMENVQLGKLNMQAPTQEQKGVEGKLSQMANQFVESTIQHEAKKAIKGMEGDIKSKIQTSIKKLAAEKMPDVEQIVNQQINRTLTENGHLSKKINESDGLFKKDLKARITETKVVEQNGRKFVVVGIDTDGKSDKQIKSEFTQYLQGTQENAETGSAMAIVDGHMVNQMLKGQKDGGSVDWSKAFESVTKDGSIESIEFNKDDNGNTIYPRIIMKDGKPYVNVDMTLTLKGKGILEGAGDITTGATGLLDDGAKAITDNTVGQLGEGGKAVGTVLRSPFWLLNKVAGGAKTVVDNTIGVVVDAVPKEATGAKLNLNVSVPLEIKTENGEVNVKAVPKGIEVGTSKHHAELSIRDVIPTRLIVSTIAQLVAEESPETAIGDEKPLAEQKVGFTEEGLSLEKVTFDAGSKDQHGDTIPNIQIHLAPNHNLQNTVAGALRTAN